MEVWVYGLRAKFAARSSSDLDMVVFTAKEQNATAGDLREAFEESSLPFRVALFIWDNVPEHFHKNIKAERVVLQKKAETNCDVCMRNLVGRDEAVVENQSHPF